MPNDNGDVRSLPLDSSDVLRHGIEAFRQYMDSIQPEKPPDPRVAELALFDQIVMMQLSFQRTTDEAIATAIGVLKARRSLESYQHAVR